MKSSPFTYPYTPFKYLRKGEIKCEIKKKKVGLVELKQLLKKHEAPKIKITGRTTEEKIFSILINPEIRFGPKNFVTRDLGEWIDKIKLFITAKKPIYFTILGFPFKIPVPLKSDRRFPDFGEILGLQRLYQITCAIKKVYPLGAVITVFAESPFASFSGPTRGEANLYRVQLKKLAKVFGFEKTVKILDLGVLEKGVPNFKKKMKKLSEEFRRLYMRKDRIFMKKFNEVFPVIFRIVNSRKYEIDDLRFVYQSDYNLGKNRRLDKIYRKLSKKTEMAIFNYFAYLKLKNDFNIVENYIPDALQLTVSPKYGRIGVNPVDKKINRLYTHGVAVYKKKEKEFDIEYLFDLLRSNKKITALYFDRDREKKPFLYIK